MNRGYSPLRYPGGKSKLFRFVSELIARNDLYSFPYREPYAGGGGLALNLLYAGFCDRIGLNDSDPAIHAFWNSAVCHSDEFCDRISRATLTIDEWYRQREIWANWSLHSEMDVGFSAFYLNRTNRSGIIEGAGPIGGYDQRSAYTIGVRFNKTALIRAISLLGRAKDRIDISGDDAQEYLGRYLNPSNFVYLDPPYYVRGRKLYRNFYSHADHLAIAHVVRNSSGPWMLSYDDVPQIREMYSWSEPTELSILYSAGRSALGREVVYLSDNLLKESDEKAA